LKSEERILKMKYIFIVAVAIGLAASRDVALAATNHPPVAGFGTALPFDGVDDNVSLPASLVTVIGGTNSITIEYWFKGSQLQSPVRFQDDAKDGDELVADTDPLNGSDYFHIVALSNTPAAKVYFTASSNRSYSLEYGTNLPANQSWVVGGHSNIPGQCPLDSLSDSNAVGPIRFYCLKVAMP